MITSKEDPLDFLWPDSDNHTGIRTVQFQEKSSKPREVLVDIQGVPAAGVIDSGVDIRIVGAEPMWNMGWWGREWTGTGNQLVCNLGVQVVVRVAVVMVAVQVVVQGVVVIWRKGS